MIRRPPRSTLDRSSAASDVYKRQLQLVVGAYGIAVVSDKNPDEIVVARKGSPLIVGVGEGEVFVASDASALPVSYTHLRAHETVLDFVCRLLL